MSTNLHLSAPENKRKKLPLRECDLYYTPTSATAVIYREGDSKYDTLMKYFKWLDQQSIGVGAILDHKLAVAMFLVENPDAKWSAW